MTDQDIPTVPVQPARRPWHQRISAVWLVPLGALVIALFIAWQNWNDQGPLIEIVFEDAAGIAPEETELRFRDIVVGRVEELQLTSDLDRVIAEVRLDKSIASYVDEGARFWIVRPQVTAQGVSGLDTVLSGVYIQGLWDDVQGDEKDEFEGLSAEPLLALGQQGLTIGMRATDGSLSGDTPIIYKGVQVGRVGPAEVSADGFSVEAEAVIYAPYDNLVTESTRFWDTSGFSLSIGTAGASVDFDSLASLIAGGVTFDTFVSGAPLAQDGAEFSIYPNPGAARTSIFDREDGAALDLQAIFQGNVSGLTTGAAVELNGLRVGEVTGLNGIVEQGDDGGTQIRLQTILSIQPSRLGLEGDGGPDIALQFLEDQVENGLRARLVTGSILTGGLKVQLTFDEDAVPAEIDMDALPFPQIPATESEITDVATTAQGQLDRIDNLPIEELLLSVTGFLDNASLLIGSPETQAVPGDVSALLASVNALVASDGVQDLPAQISVLMDDLSNTVAQVDAIVTSVEEEQVVARVAVAIDNAARLTATLDTTLEGVPALITQITELADTANDLSLEQLVAGVTAVADNAASLIASDGMRSLPGQIGATVESLRGTLDEARTAVATLNEGEGVAQIIAAVAAVEDVATSLDASLEGVPELIAEVGSVAATAAELPLEQLVARATAVADGAASLMESEATQGLPSQLGAAVGSLQRTLAEAETTVATINDGEGVSRLLAAVDSAGQAADTLDASLAGLPALIAEIEAVAANAADLPLDALVAQVTGLSASARTLISTEEAQALPGQIGALSGELQRTLGEVGTLVGSLNEEEAATRILAAVDGATDAATTVGASFDGVPALIERLNGIAADAQGLELDALIARVTSLVGAADTLIAQDTTRALPGELNAALAQLRLILAEVNEGGAIENTNATLLAARNAANEIAAAAEGLPVLLTRASTLIGQADAQLATLGDESSPALRDARAALREVSEAAEAVSSLARALERNPNSLLLGR